MSSFTQDASAAGEARIQSDLQRIVNAVRIPGAQHGLLAVYLLGGYARGEGTVVQADDGTLRGFNDYDLLLVFQGTPPGESPYAALARELARELEIDFVDLGQVAVDVLSRVPATLFWYELGVAHQLLWSVPGYTATPRTFSVMELEPEESTRLLCNRGMGLLWAARRLWPRTRPGESAAVGDAHTLRFASIAAHKAILASGDAALLRSGDYVPDQRARADALATHPALISWAPADFLGAYRRAVAFRRAPEIGDAASVGELWLGAFPIFEAGYRASELTRLEGGFSDWPTYATVMRSVVREQEFGGVRATLRTVVRGVRGRDQVSTESRRFGDLAELLFQNASDVAAWCDQADTLIGKWHP